MPFDLERQENVFILTMDEDDNRFNESSLARLNEALDEVEAFDGPSALVTTGSGKFFSNGLDLDWIMSGEASWSFAELAMETQRLFARTLIFPRPTVAAINGHCFAAAAMWSLAHDFRVMVGNESVLPAAIELAASLAEKDADTLVSIKAVMYNGIVEALTA